jgi:hypothetical protein
MIPTSTWLGLVHNIEFTKLHQGDNPHIVQAGRGPKYFAPGETVEFWSCTLSSSKLGYNFCDPNTMPKIAHRHRWSNG